MSLMDFQGIRRPENAMSGARLTGAGHALAAGVGLAGLGRRVMGNALMPKARDIPGIQQAPIMGADMRQSPTMGASGSLSMALSDLEQTRGVTGMRS